MKKSATILTMALILSVCNTTVISARHMHGRHHVDVDETSICDNYATNTNGCNNHSGCGKGYVDADGDGICDNHATNTNGCNNHSGCGKGYVDADGDGICDNYSANGNDCNNRSGYGKGYVDADGDGVCDNTKYNIKYNLNGGKNNKKNPSCYDETTKTIKLKKPTKKGYTFKGWYADKQCEKKVTSIKKGSSGKKTLYAKWKKNNKQSSTED